MITKSYINMSQEELKAYISGWISHFSGSEDSSINEFWISYFEVLLRKECFKIFKEDFPDDESVVDNDTGIIKVPKSLFVRVYKDKVFYLLEKNKNEKDKKKLVELQNQIEELTMKFSETSSFKTSPSIMSMLTKTDMPNAKEYLRGKYKLDDLGRLQIDPGNKDYENTLLRYHDLNYLKYFGEHTLECLLVHTLSYLFNMENMVSLASLVDRIERSVRHQIKCLVPPGTSLKEVESHEEKSIRRSPFGTALVEFLVERKLLVIFTENFDSSQVKKKGKNYYKEKYNYASCTFDTALLPIKLSLPMVSPPLDWTVRSPTNGRCIRISDIYGGYLSNPTGEIFTNYRMMSSPDMKSFFIDFDDIESLKEYERISGEERANLLCQAINGLQRQAFRINSVHLKNLIDNYQILENTGLLMPKFLSDLKLGEACDLLREVYNRTDNQGLRSKYGFSGLATLLSTNMQRSQYEQTIIQLAKAYEGYSFYYPAFLDFRGRVYRSGIFHFHERDFARSLLLIDNSTPIISPSNSRDLLKRYLISTAFHYKNFTDENAAGHFMENKITALKEKINGMNKEKQNPASLYHLLINESKDAKRLFQYMANMTLVLPHFQPNSIMEEVDLNEIFHSVPVTKDASASAYQIMSYFLLDTTMARKTNLIENEKNFIIDIYYLFRRECLDYIKSRCDNLPLYHSLELLLTRKVIKKIFMPIIYGKTINSTIKDLIIILGKNLLPKECVLTAKLCFSFWEDKYQNLNSFIDLISLVGRVCSSLEQPVVYYTPYFNTNQDYKKMESCTVRAFDKRKQKTRSVTLTFPSDERDKRKSRASTFVNFIHQKDAQIAMAVAVKSWKKDIPLYTVHDNFISNTLSCELLPKLYCEVYKEMEPPLVIINRFIYINLIKPVLTYHLHYNSINSIFPNLNKKDYDFLEAVINTDGHVFDRLIIPEEFLRLILNHKMPLSEAKNMKGWNKIKEKVITRYKEYYEMVGVDDTFSYSHIYFCGSHIPFIDNHISLWDSMKSHINGNFSIHH